MRTSASGISGATAAAYRRAAADDVNSISTPGWERLPSAASARVDARLRPEIWVGDLVQQRHHRRREQSH